MRAHLAEHLQQRALVQQLRRVEADAIADRLQQLEAGVGAGSDESGSGPVVVITRYIGRGKGSGVSVDTPAPISGRCAIAG
ncbi:MAG: hypothetical protein ACXWZV_06960 [Solirubrobacterales bacterium]